MKRNIALILIILFMFLRDSKEDVAGPLTTLSSSIALLKEIGALLKKEKSYQLSSYTPQNGFDSLIASENRARGYIKIEDLDNYINLWFDKFELTALEREEAKLFIRSKPQEKTKHEYGFRSGSGHFSLLVLLIEPNPQTSNEFIIERILYKADFTLSSPFFIATTSDCGWFSCVRTDSIVYLQPHLNEQHITTLMKLMGNPSMSSRISNQGTSVRFFTES